MIYYRALQMKDINEGMLKNFVRYQETTHIFRRTSEGLMMDRVKMISDWDEEKKKQIIDENFKRCIQNGIVCGAFDDGKLIGFSVIPSGQFGSHHEYMLLSMCHVSADYRRKSIGRQLFKDSLSYVRRSGCSKLYISSHPSLETQLFYKRMGCTLAEEYIEEVSKTSPSDIPLEYKLR